MTKKIVRTLIVLLFGCGHAQLCLGGESLLFSMDIERLMEMNVTTVTKRSQPLGRAAAAIYVIDQTDIKRSGATSLPEILSLAPGLNVAQISASNWAVSARGLMSQYANKLLVIVDGRSVYNPLFAGVFWDSVLPPINEIERIEIIRGPGTSLWGANAVNGIINIITFDSEVTQNTSATIGAGNEERAFVRLREGFRADDLTGRISADLRSVDDGRVANTSTGSRDDFKTYEIASRFDWRPRATDVLTLDSGVGRINRNGELYLDEAIEPFVDPLESFYSEMAWITGSWIYKRENSDSLQTKIYTDWENRVDQVYRYKRNTIDTEFQYNHSEWMNQKITWGISAKATKDEADGGFVISFVNRDRTYNTITAFIQNEISLSNFVSVIVGSKFEDGDYIGIEPQPTLRIAIYPDENMTLWAAVSRSIRSPSPFEREVVWRSGFTEYGDREINKIFPSMAGKVYIEEVGNGEFRSEIVNNIEFGARCFAGKRVYFDVALYETEYENLANLNLTGYRVDYPVRGYYGLVVQLDNGGSGYSDGVEVSSTFDASSSWSVKAGYTHTKFKSSSPSLFGQSLYGGLALTTPRNTAYVMSHYELPLQASIDFRLEYKDSALDRELFGAETDEYHDLSIKISKSLSKNTAISLVGKQLLDSSRLQFVNTFLGPIQTEIERSVYVQFDWLQN